MALNIDERYLPQVNELMSKLPQNPFVVDIIGKAIEIGEANTKADYMEALKIATKVAEYISDKSSSTMYKYSIIAAVLLAGVEPEKYTAIDTASGTVREYTELFTAFVKNSGWKDAWMQLNKIAQKDMDLFYAALIVMIVNLEDIIAREEIDIAGKYVLAGIAYIEASLRKSAITVPNRMYPDYNHFMTLVMKKADF